MNKNEFLTNLYDKISILSEKEKNKTISYYSEILDDRIENGMSEKEAVNRLEEVNVIAQRILSESDALKENIKFEKIFKFIDNILKSHSNIFIIAILILGIPLWLPIIGSVFSVVSTICFILIGGIIAGSIGSILAIIFSVGIMFSSPLIGMFLFGLSLIGVGFTTIFTLLTVKLTSMVIKICKKIIFNIKIWWVRRRAINEKIN